MDLGIGVVCEPVLGQGTMVCIATVNYETARG